MCAGKGVASAGRWRTSSTYTASGVRLDVSVASVGENDQDSSGNEMYNGVGGRRLLILCSSSYISPHSSTNANCWVVEGGAEL